MNWNHFVTFFVITWAEQKWDSKKGLWTQRITYVLFSRIYSSWASWTFCLFVVLYLSFDSFRTSSIEIFVLFEITRFYIYAATLCVIQLDEETETDQKYIELEWKRKESNKIDRAKKKKITGERYTVSYKNGNCLSRIQ